MFTTALTRRCAPWRILGTLIVLTIAMSILPNAARAQSFNIDLDSPTSPPALGGGVPSSAYPAAASQPGVWNSYPTTLGPVSLVDLAGGATSASVAIISSTTVSTLAFNNGSNSGDFALLMNDAQQIGTQLQGGSRAFTFTGLIDGPYSVFTYGSPPQPGNLGQLFVDIPGSNEGQLMTSGAHAGNTFAQGTTHVIHTLNVVGGSMIINTSDVPGAPAAYVNGFQLTRVPEPSGLVALILLAPSLLARARSSHGHRSA